MEETLLTYIQELPPLVRIVIFVLLIVSVLVIPSLININEYLSSLKDKIKDTIQNRKNKKEERIQREIEEREFRQNVASIMTSIPDIYSKINSAVHDIEMVVSSSKQNSENNERIESVLSKMGDDLSTLSKISKENDERLTDNSKTNRDNISYLVERVDSLTSTVENIDSKVKLLVDGDIDDFRTFLIQVYNQCIAGDHVLSKRELSVLRNKYIRYRAEGGNGWAKRLMGEMAEELGDSELMELCREENN